jgi:hypothetical protein
MAYASPLYVSSMPLWTTLHYCTPDAGRLKTAGRIKQMVERSVAKPTRRNADVFQDDAEKVCVVTNVFRHRHDDSDDGGVTTATCHWRRRGWQRRRQQGTTIWTRVTVSNVSTKDAKACIQSETSEQLGNRQTEATNTGVRDQLLDQSEWVSMFDFQTARSL